LPSFPFDLFRSLWPSFTSLERFWWILTTCFGWRSVGFWIGFYCNCLRLIGWLIDWLINWLDWMGTQEVSGWVKHWFRE
jgi:hypothetical protein